MRGRASITRGVGLRNVGRRLVCYDGDRASFDLRAESDRATVAELVLVMGARCVERRRSMEGRR
jgi:hypothetical protein